MSVDDRDNDEPNVEAFALRIAAAIVDEAAEVKDWWVIHKLVGQQLSLSEICRNSRLSPR